MSRIQIEHEYSVRDGKKCNETFWLYNYSNNKDDWRHRNLIGALNRESLISLKEYMTNYEIPNNDKN